MIRYILSAAAIGMASALVMPLSAEAQTASTYCPYGGSDYCNFTVSPGFLPDPVIGTGQSSGPRFTNDCGYVDTVPDHVVTVTQRFDYMRAHVVSGGDVTLLIQGPNGRFCSDDANGLLPALAGPWPPGEYQIWIGDWGQSYYRYTLYLTEYTH